MDTFERYPVLTSDPAVRHFAIVPNDGADMAVRPRGIYCQAQGTLMVRDEVGVTLPYAMTAGQLLPFRGVRVMESTTGTYYGWV